VVPKTDHYAVVIGIDKYSQFRRLRSAVKDATRFAEWLTSCEGGGLPKKNTHLIVSEEEREEEVAASPFRAIPLQTEVDEALAKIGVLSKSRIGSRLYFYFAGHGFGPNFEEVGMLMANAAMERLNSNVGLRPYRHFFRDWGFFDEVIFILDCCRDEFVSVSQTTGPTFTLGQITQPRPPVNDFIVMAAPHGEKAFQAPDAETRVRRGLLTEALLEALKKAEAADPLGRFTATSLCEYIAKRVPELAGEVVDPKTNEPLKQDPAVVPPQKEIVFGTLSLGEADKLTARIIVSPGLNGVIELRRGSDMKIIASRDAGDITAEKPPWEEQLLRQQWYALTNSTSPPGTPPTIIDLRNVKDAQHVITV
jgi:hypothetical protein